jgi:hypothetical protein
MNFEVRLAILTVRPLARASPLTACFPMNGMNNSYVSGI